MASAARNVAARTIHIKMQPTPRSLPERREVIRVLERFGEVEMFRSLKYDPTHPVPDAFLSILSTEEAVQAALEASPIRYRLIADPAPPVPSSDLSSASSSTSPPQPPPPPPHIHDSIFELRISPSSYNHHASITSSPLHGPYTSVRPSRSFIAMDLATRIPASIAKAGLIDWVTDSAGRASSREERATWATASATAEEHERATVQWGRGGGGGGAGWEEMKKPWRLRDKEKAKRENAIPWVMKGLKSRPQEKT